MSNTNFMSYGDAEGVLTGFSDRIKQSPPQFIGTVVEWEALSASEKARYKIIHLTDDGEALGVDPVDAVQDGNMAPVTSNAVYNLPVDTIRGDYGNRPITSKGIYNVLHTGFHSCDFYTNKGTITFKINLPTYIQPVFILDGYKIGLCQIKPSGEIVASDALNNFILSYNSETEELTISGLAWYGRVIILSSWELYNYHS